MKQVPLIPDAPSPRKARLGECPECVAILEMVVSVGNEVIGWQCPLCHEVWRELPEAVS